ncbi:unnamed protein product [Prorocentrum cordatum]|uniref:Uncharacterized protein n=1 Tax=Prorocentrum cordatum TaxID=2364126 RepID=A0ABN9QTD0_9DINO|nr:unnamed protein product [Polarella glacialis]
MSPGAAAPSSLGGAPGGCTGGARSGNTEDRSNTSSPGWLPAKAAATSKSFFESPQSLVTTAARVGISPNTSASLATGSWGSTGVRQHPARKPPSSAMGR